MKTARRKERIIDTRKARAATEDAVVEVAGRLIQKQCVKSTRITSLQIVLTICLVLTAFQGLKQPVVEDAAEETLQVVEENMEAEEAIILKLILPTQ